jgi:hypothetical protein
MFNLVGRTCGRAIALFSNQTIAHDKGKPVAKQGRKAVSLPGKDVFELIPSEIVWLPKASDTVVGFKALLENHLRLSRRPRPNRLRWFLLRRPHLLKPIQSKARCH